MSVIWSILVFLLSKSAETAGGWWLLEHFKLKLEAPTLALYGGLSFVQFLFVLYASASRGKGKSGNPEVIRYAPAVFALMGVTILAAVGVTLAAVENAITPLLLILSALVQVISLSAYLLQLALGNAFSKVKSGIPKPGFLPDLLLACISLGTPAALGGYFFYHFVLFPSKPVASNSGEYLAFSLAVITGSAALQMLLAIASSIHNALRGKLLGKAVDVIELDTPHPVLPLADANVLGYLGSRIRLMLSRFEEEKDQATLLSGYLSHKIRADVTKSGLNLEGDQKSVTVLTVRYNPPENLRAPDAVVRMHGSIARILGELSMEYDAYPLFRGNCIQLVFGVPAFFDHQKYNALETAQKALAEIDAYASRESITLTAYAGIYSGTAIVGAILSRGTHQRELIITGQAVQLSEKITEACESVKCRIIACSNTIEKLRTKFYIDRSFRLKLGGDEVTLVHEVRP